MERLESHLGARLRDGLRPDGPHGLARLHHRAMILGQAHAEDVFALELREAAHVVYKQPKSTAVE